jgi:acyl-CoA synthetase (AMP-forming)/AMP-acid ligase II
VYSKNNPITGQIVAAQLVIDENKIKKENIKATIRAFCIKKLDSYKVPVYIEIVSSVNYSDRYKKNRLIK